MTRSKLDKAVAFANVNTKMKLTDVAKKFGVKVQSLYQARNYAKQKATNTKTEQAWTTVTVSTSPKPITDMVNHPPHYKAGGIETIDFIEAKGLNYNLGNVVKYITRADLKGNRTLDLEKALWYLNREINTLQGEKK